MRRPTRLTAVLPILSAAFLAAAILVAAPRLAVGQSSVESGSGFALLVYESSSGRLAGAATSSLPAAASDGLRVIPGVAGIYAAGRRAPTATAEVAEGLRTGQGAASAVRAGVRGTESLRVALLTPDCESPDAGSPAFVGPVKVRRGSVPGGCYLAMAVQPADSGALDRMVSAYRDGGGQPLAPRLVGALEATRPDESALVSSRSAVLWLAASGEGRGLRLQVEDHPRPASRLRDQLGIVEARELARSADRLIGRGAYDEAIGRADSALALDPGSPHAWMQKGRAQLFAGRSGAAETSFRRMLELSPSMLRYLGDPTGPTPTVNGEVIPYAPRLLIRLDVYRRAYFSALDFGPPPPGPGRLPPDPTVRDTAHGGEDG